MKIYKYCLLLTLLSSVIAGCKKEKNAQPIAIEGNWVASYYYPVAVDKTNREAYKFNADSSYSLAKYKVDTVSGQPVAYQSIATGKYHLKIDKLELYDISVKYSDGYGPLDKLVNLYQYKESRNYTIVYNLEEKSFYFNYGPCPVNGDCLAALTYYKK